jgi:hypothetical protein
VEIPEKYRKCLNYPYTPSLTERLIVVYGVRQRAEQTKSKKHRANKKKENATKGSQNSPAKAEPAPINDMSKHIKKQ